MLIRIGIFAKPAFNYFQTIPDLAKLPARKGRRNR